MVRQYPIGPQSRLTLYVDAIPELAAEELSAVVRSTDGAPIVVERAMYSSLPGQAFAAGHNSAGVTAPATRWFLAEGATGSFFDLYVLIANPSDEAAEVDVEFLLANGTVVPKHYRIAANSRYTMSVKGEDPRLRDAVLSTIVTSANQVPIVVERVMWWPSPAWFEGHNSPGETTKRRFLHSNVSPPPEQARKHGRRRSGVCNSSEQRQQQLLSVRCRIIILAYGARRAG